MLTKLIEIASGGLESIVDELIKAATSKIKERLSEVFSIKKIGILKENISRIGKVKTIFNPDLIVDLNDIFFDNAIHFNNGERIDHFSFFSCNHVLVEGGPGQGKSMYLRRLCLNEGSGSSHIPIFIEFRNLKFEKNLKTELISAISDFGIDLNDNLFDYLAKSEKVLFILDGFDEIPNSVRSKVAKELETIARTYANLKIIISSRPDSGMGASVYFKIYKIRPLPLECQLEFVDHLCRNNDQSSSIVKILSENKFLSEVTNTPLLLTLFTITYNARQFKPDSLSEFYNLIFPTMLYRHDRMKIGFERERKSGLTDYQMQRVFEAFSFISLRDNKTRFSSSYFRKYLETASKLERLNANLEDKLIDDITRISALVIRDGFDDYSFSHKSIQEYFAAVFISRLDEKNKKEFYQTTIANFDEFRKWQNSLAFLLTIDDRSYTKYFLLPSRKRALNINDQERINLNYKSIMQLVGEDSKIQVNEEGELISAYWGDTFSSVLFKEYSNFCVEKIIIYFLQNREKLASFLAFCNELEYEKFQIENGDFIIKMDDFFRVEKLQKDLSNKISKEFEKSNFIAELTKIERDLKNSDKLVERILQF